ncbi:MAG TPA: methyltransferase [Glaciihabitans sp.]|jgi:16S rRNA (guanine1207-N2)-methyltransferase|nr:methyltransferase [Glaciihabitans sp.]
MSDKSTTPDLALRRFPDVEADNLFAIDAADRLLLDEAAPYLEGIATGELVVIGDSYGALTLGAITRFGARDVRVHQDRVTGEHALDYNSEDLGIESFAHHTLDSELVAGARVVLLRLPRGLDALDEIAALIAAHAHPDVVVVAGNRIKHLTTAMNEVLLKHFGRLDITHARQKARVLVAREPLPAAEDAQSFPLREFNTELNLWVCAHGGAFAGTKLDIGTRFLLEHTKQMKADATNAIDLGSGTGIIAAVLATQRPELRVIATDQSWAAVSSTEATAEANSLSDRIEVVRDNGLYSQPDASADLIVLNPPFHIEGTVHLGEALKLFEEAGRVLRPGGELWTVFNSHLGYRSTLSAVVGPTRQVARNAKFSVMVSTRD